MTYDSTRASARKTSYSEKLLDPRWQRKRLEILQRDGFKCVDCGDETKTLHVHHCYYDNATDGPWDYPDHSLVTLCVDCHEQEEDEIRIWRGMLQGVLALQGVIRARQLQEILGAFLRAAGGTPLSADELSGVSSVILHHLTRLRRKEEGV